MVTATFIEKNSYDTYIYYWFSLSGTYDGREYNGDEFAIFEPPDGAPVALNCDELTAKIVTSHCIVTDAMRAL